MAEQLDIDLLQLSAHKPQGFVPRPSTSLLRRMELQLAVDPVVVRPAGQGRYEILSNPETWVAAGELAWHSIPVHVLDDVDDQLAAEIVRDSYADTRDDPIDEAEGFLAIMERKGWWDGSASEYPRGAISRVAKEVGRSRPYVANALRLLKLPLTVQEDVRAGVLTIGQARPLLGLSSRTDQLQLAERIKRTGMTARQVEDAVKSSTPQGFGFRVEDPPKPAEKHPDILRLEKQVTALLGAEFTIDEGRAVINYYGDLSILDGVLERIGYRG